MIDKLRKLPQAGATIALIILAACSVGDATSPTQLSPAVQKQLLANGEVAEVLRDVSPADTQYAQFKIGGKDSRWHTFGPHKLYVRGSSICKLSSPYGIEYWLTTCSTLGEDSYITVTAKWWTDSRGYARAEFKPDLRFRPDRPAQLHLQDELGAKQGTSAVLYCQDGTNICYNESATDATLVTNRDPATGWVWRFIRHFSGYNVWA